MFASVIALYRASGRPPVIGDRFSFQGIPSAALDTAVAACQLLDLGFGHFEDGPEREDGVLEFTWALSSNESGRFYQSIGDFVARCESIHRGAFPDTFYIAELDFVTGETPHAPVAELVAIDHICELIRLLAELSLSGNLAAGAGRPAHLVFVKPASSGTPPTTLEIITQIQTYMLGAPKPDIAVLRDLLGPHSHGKVRTEEYKALFRLAVASVCAEESAASSRFTALIERWDRILQRFRYDVECVVDRLSFDALRRDIAEAELTFVGRVNTTVVENATKFLGIPVSLVAVATIVSGDSIASDVLVCLGALIVALVVSGVSKATRLQLGTTTTAFNAAVSGMRARAKVGGDVAGSLDLLAGTYDRRRKFATQVIGTFQTLAWLPPVIAVAIIAWRFPPPWMTSLLTTWTS